MLSEEQIFTMSDEDLEEKIELLNKIHISIKQRENPRFFSYRDYGGQREDVLSDKKLVKTINTLEMHDLINNLNSNYFYKLIDPILEDIMHKKIAQITDGYEIEFLIIQTSLPLSAGVLVNDYSPPDDSLIPHVKGFKNITYSELEDNILESFYSIKYLLNRGQCGNFSHIDFDTDELKELIKISHFYNLDMELKNNEIKKNKNIKI